MQKSKVSVIVSTFNGIQYLDECIQSVLKQTYDNLEFVILDDGSSDDSYEKCSSYAQKDNRIKLYKNDLNRGTGYCWIRLLSLCSGDYIAPIGQDDVWNKDYLETAIQKMNQNPTASACFSYVQIIDSKSQIKSAEESPFQIELASNLNSYDLFCILLKHNLLCASASIFRRQLISEWESIGFNDQLQDWDTWLFLIQKGHFIFNKLPLVQYRIHGNNLSLASHCCIQAKIESQQTRLNCLINSQLSRYILSHYNPDAFINTIITVLLEIAGDNEEEMKNFFFALRKHEEKLSQLQSFEACLGSFFVYFGCYTKAKRYSLKANPIMSSPQIFRNKFKKNIVICLKDNTNVVPSPFYRTKEIGPLLIILVFSNTKKLSFINFNTLKKTKNTDLLLENLIQSKAKIVKIKSLNIIALGKTLLKKVLPNRFKIFLSQAIKQS